MTELEALRAEVERLRARVAELESIKPLLDAERLAAANALLARVQAWDARQDRHEVGEAFINIMIGLDDHLAAQPATKEDE